MTIEAVLQGERTAAMKAPFPAFGGKRKVAPLVWDRLGDVANFIEPFCNSAAVLLNRPHAGRIETVNDWDCYVANFWRATKHDPSTVAEHADNPVNEADLHARHRWLVLSEDAAEFRQRMRSDPEYYDPKVAGYWCWGACCWIGSGWCPEPKQLPHLSASGGQGLSQQLPHLSASGGQGLSQQLPRLSASGGQGLSQQLPHLDASGGQGLSQQLPHLDAVGRAVASGPIELNGSRGDGSAAWQQRPHIGVGGPVGIHAGTHDGKRPVLRGKPSGSNGQGVTASEMTTGPSDAGRPQLADAFSRGRGVNGNDNAGTCEQRLSWLIAWLCQLRDRLRTVRVCCGDWIRVCDSPSTTTRLGVTGIFLDAPYKTHTLDGKSNRAKELYASDRDSDVNGLVDRVIAYCLERGSDPQMRIAACCYEGEGYEVLAAEGWTVESWKASGGYGNQSGKVNENAGRERIWFSPHCRKPAQQSLFGADA